MKIAKTSTGAGTVASRPRRRETFARWMFIIPAVLYVVLYFGYPIIKTGIMGFQDYGVETFYTGEAPWVAFDNYVKVFNSQIFTTALSNTLIFTLVSMTFQFVFGLGLALFFSRKFPLNGFIRSLMLTPWLLPLIAGTASWKIIFDQDNGILNAFLGAVGLPDATPWLSSTEFALASVILVNIWVGIPFHLTVLYSGLKAIPEELYEAASLDGATGWKKFLHITIPSLRPVLTVSLVLGVIYTLKVMDIILGLTDGGPANATQTLATYSYDQSFVQFDFGVGAAISNILILVSLIFTVVYLRLSRKANDS